MKAIEEQQRIASERDFHNRRFADEVRQPTHGFYRVVQGAFDEYDRKLFQLTEGNDVLEYGCSFGQNAVRLASCAKSIVGIDLSDVAVERARKTVAKRGISNASFQVMNAEDMSFSKESFDFVFGSSILHHLELEKAYESLSLVLRPGGRGLFLEPLGHNPAINAYRDRTPDFRTPDEHPLMKRDIDLAGNYFSKTSVKFFGLAGLFAIPLLKTRLSDTALAFGRTLDGLACNVPGVRWLSWFSVIEFVK